MGSVAWAFKIGVLDIGRIFKDGRESIAAGDDDQALGDEIAALVETIRQN
jgi:hypothetical protein